MYKIFKNKDIYVYMMIVFIFFGILIGMTYSVDTYLLLASPRMSYVFQYLYSGRIFTFLYFFILGIFKFPPYIMYLLSFMIALVVTSLSIYELNSILEKYVNNKLLSKFLSIIIIINPFVIELWLFIEMGIMMTSVLAFVLAFKNFNMYLECKEKNNLVKILVYLLIGVFCYQGTAGIFIALSLISILFKCKTKRDFLKNNVLMFLLYIIPVFINYLFIILFNKTRVGGIFNFNRTASIIINSSKLLINGFGLLPKGFNLIIILISIILSVIYLIKCSNKNFIYNLFSIIYIIIVIYLITIAPIIPQTGERIAFYPRTCYAFYSFIGITYIFFSKKINYKILLIIVIMFLSVELYSFIKIEINRYKVNNNDKKIVLKINKEVEKYEKKTGKLITKLAIYNEKKSQKFYSDINDNINVSAIKENPSVIATYIYYTNHILIYTNKNSEVEKKFFKELYSNKFSLNQIVILDDTLHWYLY